MANFVVYRKSPLLKNQLSPTQINQDPETFVTYKILEEKKESLRLWRRALGLARKKR